MWQAFLDSRYAPLLTHVSLIALTAGLFALLLELPFWIAFFPCALIQHRIGVLLHEYIHGIPFSSQRANQAVLSLFDGLMLMFGLLELFRGTHLAHHRWLNRDGDPAFRTAHKTASANTGPFMSLEAVQHFVYLLQSFRGEQPYVRPGRIAIGAGLSLLWAAFWMAVGSPRVALELLALTIYNTSIPVSLRGAVEHHSYAGDPSSANEYRVLIPLFNLNKHIHHHEEPRRPWYLLEYRTARPLSAWRSFTHWFQVYLTRQYVLMRPPR